MDIIFPLLQGYFALFILLLFFGSLWVFLKRCKIKRIFSIATFSIITWIVIGALPIYPLAYGLGIAQAYTKIAFSQYYIPLVLLAIACLFFAAFLTHSMPRRETIPVVALLLTACVFITVAVFANIYSKYGIIESVGVNRTEELSCGQITKVSKEGDILTKDFESCLYFSAVTFTTLGYGDFRPPYYMRVVAAYEALLGYLFLSVTAAVVINLLRTQNYEDTVAEEG